MLLARVLIIIFKYGLIPAGSILTIVSIFLYFNDRAKKKNYIYTKGTVNKIDSQIENLCTNDLVKYKTKYNIHYSFKINDNTIYKKILMEDIVYETPHCPYNESQEVDIYYNPNNVDEVEFDLNDILVKHLFTALGGIAAIFFGSLIWFGFFDSVIAQYF